MTTSGTYNFDPSVGILTLYAYQLCGIRPTELTQQHFESARMASNMVVSSWSARGVNLWQVDLQVVPLVQGTATYSIPSNTIVMLDSYVVVGSGTATNNRLITPISRTEYASFANPQMQGVPTSFWFDRLLSPTVTLWPVPNGNEISLNYYRLRQTQDANLANAQTPEIPVYFMEAFSYALAQRLAVIWAADRVAILKPLADEAYQIATDQNVESSNFYISPQISSYFQ